MTVFLKICMFLQEKLIFFALTLLFKYERLISFNQFVFFYFGKNPSNQEMNSLCIFMHFVCKFFDIIFYLNKIQVITYLWYNYYYKYLNYKMMPYISSKLLLKNYLNKLFILIMTLMDFYETCYFFVF